MTPKNLWRTYAYAIYVCMCVCMYALVCICTIPYGIMCCMPGLWYHNPRIKLKKPQQTHKKSSQIVQWTVFVFCSMLLCCSLSRPLYRALCFSSPLALSPSDCLGDSPHMYITRRPSAALRVSIYVYSTIWIQFLYVQGVCHSGMP